MRTPRRNAVPLARQSLASILVASRASCILLPEAITAHTIAPAEEPANGVVSCIKPKIKKKRKKPKKNYRARYIIKNRCNEGLAWLDFLVPIMTWKRVVLLMLQGRQKTKELS